MGKKKLLYSSLGSFLLFVLFLSMTKPIAQNNTKFDWFSLSVVINYLKTEQWNLLLCPL